jgi:hypothetical protein
VKRLLILLAAMASAQAAEPQISAGRYHNLAVASDGAVYWWGADDGLRYYLQRREAPRMPYRVADLPPAKAVAAGWAHSVALAQDGSVYEWGFSPYRSYQVVIRQPMLGLCEAQRLLTGGHGKDPCKDEEIARFEKMRVTEPLKIPGLPEAKAIAAGDNNTLMVSTEGEVYCWSRNVAPHRLPGLEHISAVSMGQFHGIALREDGAVLTWGAQLNGRLGRPSGREESVCTGAPQPQAVFTGAVAIAAGVENSYAMRADGSVWAWGEPWNKAEDIGSTGLVTAADAAGLPNLLDQFLPRRIGLLDQAVLLAAGDRRVGAGTAAGQVIEWGVLSYKQYINAPTLLRKGKGPFVTLKGEQLRALSIYSSTLALRADGFICISGENMYGPTHPDSKLWQFDQALPVLLADGTPLNLLDPHAAAPATLCGSASWRQGLAAVEAADLQFRQRREREWKLIEQLGMRPGESAALVAAVVQRNRAAGERVLATPGYDINTADNDGVNALYYALAPGVGDDWANWLLDRGADPQLHNKLGQTALMLAARNQSPTLVRRLLALGLDPNARSQDGSTALMYAADGGNAENVGLLLKAGADPKARNLLGDSLESLSGCCKY